MVLRGSATLWLRGFMICRALIHGTVRVNLLKLDGRIYVHSCSDIDTQSSLETQRLFQTFYYMDLHGVSGCPEDS